MSLEFAAFDAARQLDERRELFDDAFPEHRGTAVASSEHYRWKFHGAPASPQSLEYTATEDGRMLGYYAAIPYPYEIAGRRVSVGMVCDVMTHSAARGRGVFTALGRHALAQIHDAGLAFVTGYPIRPEVMGGHLRAGWTVAFRLPMYLMPLRTNAILGSRGLGWAAPLANAGARAYVTVLAPRAAGGGAPVHGRAGLTASTMPAGELIGSAGLDRLLARWAATVPNHLVKSAEFYRWRLGAPGTEYVGFAVGGRGGAGGGGERGDLEAVAFGREAVLQGIPSLALLDVMAPDPRRDTLAALYGAIVAEGRRRGVEAIVTMMSRHSARRYRLARHGYLRSPFAFKLIVRATSSEVDAAQLSREGDWHLMWIDSDDL